MSAYPDIDAWVNYLVAGADAADVDFIVPGVVAELLVLGNCFTTYAALSATEKVFFDKAAGFKAAYILYNKPSTSSVAGSGDVKRKTQDGLTVEYDVGTSVRTQGNTAFWLTEFENALGQICPEAIGNDRRVRSSIPVSNLPNSSNPTDSLYPSDVERAEAVG